MQQILQTLNSIKFTIMCFALAYYFFGLGAGIFGAAIGLVSDVISDVMERRFQAAEDKGSKIFETVEILPCIFIIINFIYAFVILTTAGATQQIPIYTSGFTAKMAQIIPAINNKQFEAKNSKEFALHVNHLLAVSWFITIILIVPIVICFLGALKKAFVWKQEFDDYYLAEFPIKGFIKTILALLFIILMTKLMFYSSYEEIDLTENSRRIEMFFSLNIASLFMASITSSLVFVKIISIYSKFSSFFKKTKIGDKNE